MQPNAVLATLTPAPAPAPATGEAQRGRQGAGWEEALRNAALAQHRKQDDPKEAPAAAARPEQGAAPAAPRSDAKGAPQLPRLSSRRPVLPEVPVHCTVIPVHLPPPIADLPRQRHQEIELDAAAPAARPSFVAVLPAAGTEARTRMRERVMPEALSAGTDATAATPALRWPGAPEQAPLPEGGPPMHGTSGETGDGGMRVHVEFGGTEAAVWLGIDQQRLAALPTIARELETRLRSTGIRITTMVCNGRVVPLRFLPGERE